ncbi:hypothetical protein H6G74_17060 [Nostoc spongiaeforme FACHB-130]|uniref:Uncharacterized protein n=1 Tax=Nostoc spongiaeforme FACHB-130 TaxID=1357510 RepID=A0ABR8FZ14_9NOSO|nr:hypothetical protein [Nostoc spongiaeforme]MBD2596021.1 hypothetical protein [Nostoc spongiaeforme FACHB-130]
MSSFEIYVKTSALGKTGIHWRKIESEEYQPVEVPSLIKRQVISDENNQAVIVNDLIDEVKPSLIILRDNEENKLLLEVTGIESPNRSNKLGRKVLNSIVWIADDLEDNEEVLRKIACSAISSILDKDLSFCKMVEESIDFFEVEEFRANLNTINKFTQQIETTFSSDNSHVKSYQEYYIGNKSTSHLEKLAEEIQNHPLPKCWISWDGQTKTGGVLVVVTENLEKRNILYKAGVWRGFASVVEEPVRNKPLLTEKKKETISSAEPHQHKKSPAPRKNQKTRFIIVLLIIAITIVVIAISFQLLFQPQTQQKPQPQSQVEQTSKTQAEQTLELQTQPTPTSEAQSQGEQTPEIQAKQILEPQTQPTPTP